MGARLIHAHVGLALIIEHARSTVGDERDADIGRAVAVETLLVEPGGAGSRRSHLSATGAGSSGPGAEATGTVGVDQTAGRIVGELGYADVDIVIGWIHIQLATQTGCAVVIGRARLTQLALYVADHRGCRIKDAAQRFGLVA